MHFLVYIYFLITLTRQDNEVIDDNRKGVDILSSNQEPPQFTYKHFEEGCQLSGDCEQLNYPCISCEINSTCNYGDLTVAKCVVSTPDHKCTGTKFERSVVCQYCYLTEEWEHDCIRKANCNSVSSPKHFYRTNCTVKNNIICLGHRTFLKNLPCNWTGGLRWSSALLFSLTLGGFGADRFYLGYWQEGIGKLFSFGGLGVWTIIDFVLIAVQYLGPADGSLYI